MPQYTQENRQVLIKTLLGPDVLLAQSFRGVEGISQLETVSNLGVITRRGGRDGWPSVRPRCDRTRTSCS
jgi:hypothetical protein